ncbi:CubicO group peptidase, beta-lactamase class C family [Microbacterium sp. cf046]|uniref:serine hydrolase domain-containing protein n=1 Tax=Microbacterium sp. cf046 TaxID=1761803 RepID=UPI0008EA7D61|nr:serine hydrolase domain-containing protein [Microbacterium sp. cf046]SFS17696.1 CubicO group peptidase, beta-lactamase class C family [Microbacterium sp. cf046]
MDAERPDEPIIDEAALDAAAAKESFTGVVTVDVGDERRFVRTDGFAHRALRVPHAPSTRIAIASGGKTFTALAVLRLVEQGILALDTRARSILGTDLPLIDDTVTIEQLLTHTSGIGDYIDEEADWDAADYVLPVAVHLLGETEAFVPVVDGYPQAFAPGSRFTYCNGGFIVLAIIAERASGREYHDLVEEEVCARAGLEKTSFLRSDELPADAALGYLFDEGDRTNVLHLPVRGNGDGGIYSTADDLHTFWRALTAGRIINPDTLAQMTEPRHDVPEERKRYGMGLWLGRTGPQLIMEGYDAGVSFRSTHNPQTGTTVSVLGNSSEGAWPVVFALADTA